MMVQRYCFYHLIYVNSLFFLQCHLTLVLRRLRCQGRLWSRRRHLLIQDHRTTLSLGRRWTKPADSKDSTWMTVCLTSTKVRLGSGKGKGYAWQDQLLGYSSCVWMGRDTDEENQSNDLEFTMCYRDVS